MNQRPPIWLVFVERLLWWTMFLLSAAIAAAMLSGPSHDYLAWIGIPL
jgi:hypothetical protein